MRRDPSGEICSVTNTLYDTRHERCAVQLAHFLGHTDVLVHEGLVIDNVIFVGGFRVGRLLETVRLSTKEVLPDVLFDKV